MFIKDGPWKSASEWERCCGYHGSLSTQTVAMNLELTCPDGLKEIPPEWPIDCRWFTFSNAVIYKYIYIYKYILSINIHVIYKYNLIYIYIYMHVKLVDGICWLNPNCLVSWPLSILQGVPGGATVLQGSPLLVFSVSGAERMVATWRMEAFVAGCLGDFYNWNWWKAMRILPLTTPKTLCFGMFWSKKNCDVCFRM